MTSGAESGTNGGRGDLRWVVRGVLVALIVGQVTANAASYPSQAGTWQPWVWEYSSGLATLLLLWPMAWLVRWAPPRPGGWTRFLLAHLAGSAAYSLAHTGIAVLLRMGVYAAVGQRYGGADVFYEYRKDLVSYAMICAALWLSDQAVQLWRRNREPTRAGGGDGPALYEIREGARVTRTPVGEILAVSSARNYVEFHLAGGAKPLARTTLGAVESELAGAGFVRVHRSWLVHPRHVRTMTPTGAGDMRLELAGGLEAPMSRRFRGALAVAARDASLAELRQSR